MAYYNEFDKDTALWLRNLCDAGHIASGFVDDRSIRDLRPEDVPQGVQAHFFAGIGLWSLALRMAGVSDNYPVFTGSCPCQPFSVAGSRRGEADERHLWPVFRDIIEFHQPPVVFGEQVASPDGRAWLSTVRADLEALGYAVGAADLCAAGVGAPHIRQRLYFGAVRVDNLHGQSLQRHAEHDRGHRVGQNPSEHSFSTSEFGRLAYAHHERRDGEHTLLWKGQENMSKDPRRGEKFGSQDVWRVTLPELPIRREFDMGVAFYRASGVGGGVDWLLCRQPSGVFTWRPVERGTLPLAHGNPSRVVQLRAYGNAIVPQVAAQFVRAFIETIGGLPPQNHT